MGQKRKSFIMNKTSDHKKDMSRLLDIQIHKAKSLGNTRTTSFNHYLHQVSKDRDVNKMIIASLLVQIQLHKNPL